MNADRGYFFDFKLGEFLLKKFHEIVLEVLEILFGRLFGFEWTDV